MRPGDDPQDAANELRVTDRRRFNADTHAAMAKLHHGHGDLIADENPFANFATENQHVLGLANASRMRRTGSKVAAQRLLGKQPNLGSF